MTALWMVIGGLAPAALILGLRRLFVVVTVIGDSMLPAYRSGDRVLVRRRALRHVRAGDVVVVRMSCGDPDPRTNDEWVIKRAAAVPGDAVPRMLGVSLPPQERVIVPRERLLVLGDNAEWSTDSRHVGYFHAAHVLGLVVCRLSPAGTGPIEAGATGPESR